MQGPVRNYTERGGNTLPERPCRGLASGATVFYLTGMGLLLAATMGGAERENENASQDRPNILWLSFEDTSPHFLSSYGNREIEMPVVDRLAREGILFEQARATAPHCSPARSTLISGTHAYAWGTDWHRQNRAVPHEKFYFPVHLREAGYFTSNNSKTDYNVRNWGQHRDRVWNAQGNNATYNDPDREPGQPFFAVFNQNSSHMGRLRSFHTEERRPFTGYEPETVDLPGYLPDLPDIRSDYSFQLESMVDLDRWVELFLDDLEERGLKEDTIIFFFSDHGGNMPRAKGYPFDTGYRIPLIIWVPERWKHLIEHSPGERSDHLIGFEDFGPSLLAMLDLDVPDHMVGKDVLSAGSEPKEFQFLFRTNHGSNYDPAHAVTDGRYFYVRFYRPHKPLGLRQQYQWGLPGYQAWDRTYRENPESLSPEHRRLFEPTPSEYLFDLDADRWELNNVAGDAEHEEALDRLQCALDEHLRETRALSFVPFDMREPDGSGTPPYERFRDPEFPLEDLHAAATIAGRGSAEYADELLEYLDSDYGEIRFWGASGLATLAQRGEIDYVPERLIQAAEEDHGHIAVTAAEALCYLSDIDRGLEILYRHLEHDHNHVAGAAQSSLETLGEMARPLATRLKEDGDSFSRRSILINLGELDLSELYGERYEEGLEVNRDRRNWRFPGPNR